MLSLAIKVNTSDAGDLKFKPQGAQSLKPLSTSQETISDSYAISHTLSSNVITSLNHALRAIFS